MESPRVAIIYIHGIGPHPRSTIKEKFAVDLRRALERGTERDEPPSRWTSEAVAACLSASGVIPAQRLTCVGDDDHGRDGMPQIDVYEVPWSATLRHGRFRWSAIRWMTNSVRNLWSVISFRPLAKGLSDTVTAAVLSLAILVTIVAAAFAALVGILVAVWFAAAPVAQRLHFVASFVPAIVWLAFMKALMSFLDRSLVASPSPDVVEARTSAQHPRRRFWRRVYDWMPAFNAFGRMLQGVVRALAWFVIIGGVVLALEQSPFVPRAVVGPVVIALFAVWIVMLLVRWFTVLEDHLGDIAAFAAEDPLDATHVKDRARIIHDIRSVVAAVGAARPDGRQYERLVLFAHSLGSALLADFLAEDADRAVLGDCAAATRLRRVNGIVVYGSPIASFRRFFASRASDERRRRERRFAQLVSSGVVTESGTLKLHVLNIWCANDAVSNPFPAELGGENREIGGPVGPAHMRYRSSRAFWACVLPALLDDAEDVRVRAQRS
ncbi:MAG TPA: hypothetical protein VGC72_16700 [Candidatus Elarobacter sp.]|jgi:hypothetical protein